MKDLSKVYPEERFGLPCSLENTKLRALIFNITSGTDCASKKLGLCHVCRRGEPCYAIKAEELYGTPLEFRRRQEQYFDSHNATYIARHITSVMADYELNDIRLQEAGDFRSQADIDKTADICRQVPGKKKNCYSARVDLDFTELKQVCRIRLSGYPAEAKKQGIPYTRVVDLGYHGTDKAKKREAWIAKARKVNKNGKNEILCPGTCKKCKACWNTDYNIVFPLH